MHDYYDTRMRTDRVGLMREHLTAQTPVPPLFVGASPDLSFGVRVG